MFIINLQSAFGSLEERKTTCQFGFISYRGETRLCGILIYTGFLFDYTKIPFNYATVRSRGRRTCLEYMVCTWSGPWVHSYSMTPPDWT